MDKELHNTTLKSSSFRSLMTSGTIDSFLELCRARNLSPNTLRAYSQRLTYLARFAKMLGKTVIELDKLDLRRYILSIMDKVSPSTVNGRIRVYRIFYKFLCVEDIIDLNPMESIYYVKEPKKHKLILTPEQFGLALKAFRKKDFAGYRDMCISLLCFDAMLRLEEVLNLKLDDIRLKPYRTIKVMGKGSKERVISFSAKTASKLILYHHMYRKDISGDLLFPSRNGTKLDPTNIYRSFINVGKKVGLKIKMGAHLLRHSAATEYLRKTGNIFLLKEILGHCDVRTTEIYLHTTIDDIIKTYEKNSPLASITF